MKYNPVEYAKYLLYLHSLAPNEQKQNIKKLVMLMSKNGDIRDWRKIEEIYESLKEKGGKKKKARVSYSGHISKLEIENDLKKYEVEFNEDKSLIGGIQIKIGDLRIDNSVAGRLAELKTILNK
jgi:F0F1-type ATP synthase delta subunit